MYILPEHMNRMEKTLKDWKGSCHFTNRLTETQGTFETHGSCHVTCKNSTVIGWWFWMTCNDCRLRWLVLITWENEHVWLRTNKWKRPVTSGDTMDAEVVQVWRISLEVKVGWKVIKAKYLQTPHSKKLENLKMLLKSTSMIYSILCSRNKLKKIFNVGCKKSNISVGINGDYNHVLLMLMLQINRKLAVCFNILDMVSTRHSHQVTYYTDKMW